MDTVFLGPNKTVDYPGGKMAQDWDSFSGKRWDMIRPQVTKTSLPNPTYHIPIFKRLDYPSHSPINFLHLERMYTFPVPGIVMLNTIVFFSMHYYMNCIGGGVGGT